MMKKILHTPEGVRDIYNAEYEKKVILEQELCRILKNYGYHAIQTPTFEFLIYLARKSVPHRPTSFTNSLTERVIHWFYDRI